MSDTQPGATTVLFNQLRDILEGDALLEDQERDLRRQINDIAAQRHPLAVQAQRLQLALFALNGDHDKTPGDANKALDGLRRELRRERNSR